MRPIFPDFPENSQKQTHLRNDFEEIKPKIRVFRYVRHEDRPAYERDGWIFAAELGPTHGYYSVLMEKIENTDDLTQKERHGATNARPDARDTPSG